MQKIDFLKVIRAFMYGQIAMASYLIWSVGTLDAVLIGRLLLQQASFMALGQLVAERKLVKRALSGDTEAIKILAGKRKPASGAKPDAGRLAAGDVSASPTSSHSS